MPRAQGYAMIVGPERTAEADTITCAHCQRVVFLHNQDGTKKADVAVRCGMCDRLMCVPCAEKARCEPFEKKLEAIERRGRLIAAMGGC